jgi:hypothetical protein
MTVEAAPASTTTPTNGAAAPSSAGGAVARAGLMNAEAAPLTPSNGTGSPAPNGNGQGAVIDMEQSADGSWRQSFASGLDEDTGKTWGNIVTRYNSPADLAKAHVSLVKSMDKRIAIPDENAKPEEWETVYNKLGRPEKPDGYKFNFPADAPWDDTDRQRYQELAPLFHKQGATQRQLDAFIQQQAELDKVAIDAARAKANTLAQQRARQMQGEWRGEDYKENMNLAKHTVTRYFGEDTDEAASLQLADGTFVLDHPVMLRFMSKIGRERAEDDRDPSAFTSGMRENTRGQIDRIEQDAIAKGLSPTDPRWPHKQLEPLYAKLHGAKNLYAHGA